MLDKVQEVWYHLFIFDSNFNTSHFWLFQIVSWMKWQETSLNACRFLFNREIRTDKSLFHYLCLEPKPAQQFKSCLFYICVVLYLTRKHTHSLSLSLSLSRNKFLELPNLLSWQNPENNNIAIFPYYSGDLNSELVGYSNGPKQFVHQMVWISMFIV